MVTSFQLPQLAALVTSWAEQIPTTDANFAVLAEMRTFVAAINGVVAADNDLTNKLRTNAVYGRDLGVSAYPQDRPKVLQATIYQDHGIYPHERDKVAQFTFDTEAKAILQPFNIRASRVDGGPEHYSLELRWV